MERAINLGNAGLGAIRIHTPLMHLTKAETVLLAKRLNLGWEAIGKSWTCYEGGEEPCGICPACILRIKGFKEAGLSDPAIG
jgi:7-cyano-7-deazaguanine synthase